MLKILAAAMENVDGESAGPSASNESENTEHGTEFFNTGRVGRRNALPDILGSNATVSTADLPDQLSALTTTETPIKATATSSNVSMEAQTTTNANHISNTSDS